MRRRDFIVSWLTDRLQELGWELKEVPESPHLVTIMTSTSVIQVQEINEDVVAPLFVDLGVITGFSPSRASSWASMYVAEFVEDMHREGFECK